MKSTKSIERERSKLMDRKTEEILKLLEGLSVAEAQMSIENAEKLLLKYSIYRRRS